MRTGGLGTYTTESLSWELSDPLVASCRGTGEDPEHALDHKVGDEPPETRLGDPTMDVARLEQVLVGERRHNRKAKVGSGRKIAGGEQAGLTVMRVSIGNGVGESNVTPRNEKLFNAFGNDKNLPAPTKYHQSTTLISIQLQRSRLTLLSYKGTPPSPQP